MKFFHSIRWRLQLWHAALLVVVLAGFGYTAWHLQWATLMQRIDGELEQRVPVVVDAMRQQLAIASPPSQQGNAPRKKRPAFGPRGGKAPSTAELWSLSARDSQLFAGAPDSSFYYAVWSSDGAELFQSASAPGNVSRPVRVAGSRGSRRLESRREFFRYLPTGECVLVGRGIARDIRDMWRFAAMLAGAGSAVCALGLLGGWWISSRALRPIAEISVTAQKIASGDLTQRIRTTDTDSELGQLVRVLNETFTRLQAAFDRQLQFTADASHELRTPLSVVLTQAQTALSRERTGDEYRECLSACQRAAQRMRQMIESLLTLARIDSGEVPAGRETCDLGRIALETCDLLRPLAEENGIQLAVEAPSVSCPGNAAQLAQVISNLVGNGIHYNRPGGSIRVRISADGDAAVLCVQDTGQGIAADDLPHIFERFYRSDKARSGSPGRVGLGLAIVQAIVRTHGGFIHVDTEPGTGSTFTVRLPGKTV
jgi:two-component system, OmpR family, sensor kinase